MARLRALVGTLKAENDVLRLKQNVGGTAAAEEPALAKPADDLAGSSASSSCIGAQATSGRLCSPHTPVCRSKISYHETNHDFVQVNVASGVQNISRICKLRKALLQHLASPA